MRSGARALGLEALIFEAADPARFDVIFGDAASQGANGLAGMASAFLNFHHQRLIELAARYRLPSIWNRPDTSETAGCSRTDQASRTCIGELPVTLPRF